MDPIEYLRGIKRRWRLVAGIMALALVGAWVLTSVIGYGGGKDTYTATVTMLQASAKGSASTSRSNVAPGSGTSSINTIAALATVDQVAQRVAKSLKYEDDPKKLSKNVEAKVDAKTGFLRITATAHKPDNAKQLADAFAKELIAFLVVRETQANTALARSLEQQIARIKADIAALDKQIKKYPAATTTKSPGGSRNGGSQVGVAPNTGTPADALIAQRTSALKSVEDLSGQLQEVKARYADADGLEIVQTAVLGKGGKGQVLPSGLGARLAIAGILGLLGGVALALIRERLDRRIRTRETLEEHFAYPVLAEIPGVRTTPISVFRRRNGKVVALSEMPAPVIDAYRLLGAGVNGSGVTVANGNGMPHDRKLRPRAILVTSVGPEDDKAVVLASLAATFAAVGKTVTVVSADFRHPAVNKELGVENQRGLSDVAASGNGGPLLSSCLWQTSVAGVWAVPSGSVSTRPDQILTSPAMRRVLMEARQMSDFVLVATSPILTSDAAHLLPEVDGVLVVVKAGTTKPELAERSSEMLKRLKAPVLGVVLTGNSEATLPRNYYRSWSMRSVIASSPRYAVRGLRTAPRTIVRGIRTLPRIPGA
ncbi:MAG: hypothetical protein ACRDKS_10425, partial [Actinomycetota bacterium]